MLSVIKLSVIIQYNIMLSAKCTISPIDIYGLSVQKRSLFLTLLINCGCYHRYLWVLLATDFIPWLCSLTTYPVDIYGISTEQLTCVTVFAEKLGVLQAADFLLWSHLLQSEIYM